MADIGHSGHLSVGDLYHNALASIQIALSFIGVKLDETDKVDIEKEDATDSGAGPWEDKRVPKGGVDSLKATELRVNPFKLLTSEGGHALGVYEGPIDKEVIQLRAWHASSSANTPWGLSACSGR
jgi:hypothetical protein